MEELVNLDIPAQAEYVVLGRLALAGLLRRRRFSDDAVADLKLAITEACSNSVRHAYDHDGGQVHLSFMLQDDRVVIRIRDEGAGFHEDDVDCPECRAIPEIKLGEGGMGISIIRAVVDEFSLEKPSEGGTVIVLTKRCDA
ncbi:MAG TPA: ATP-binding protein [Thermoleophilia bacterium]|nr:ATP-binding protein [Thermoleophilia bacterium]HQG02713.1 ATP-binding protein [Thermoleophilia bacterium]HQG54258.1 ATP-binding protein [Thermoleophilia bacterium]HQJ97114.1 ATP-binding protein [Thermoleophilia bacterium]